jgi:hypothetical protein
VRSIMMNYAPTAFATFLEPMWLILSRLLCLLKPYEVLRLGGAKVSQSIGLKYTSIPPQLAVWRALRAKHILLATVCFTTVSTNFLAVFLAGLLNEGLTTDVLTYEGSQKWLPAFKNTTSILRGGAPIENRASHRRRLTTCPLLTQSRITFTWRYLVMVSRTLCRHG